MYFLSLTAHSHGSERLKRWRAIHHAKSQSAPSSAYFFHYLADRKSIAEDVAGVWFLWHQAASYWQLLKAESDGPELRDAENSLAWVSGECLVLPRPQRFAGEH